MSSVKSVICFDRLTSYIFAGTIADMIQITMYRMFFTVLAVVALTVPTYAAERQRPNIIFILADDLGPGELGCYGGKVAATPNIDRLAREGTRFEQFYVASPICSPSRCALITGQFPARWQIVSYLDNRKHNRGTESVDFLDPKAPSLPRVLKASGYRTAHIGKWHLGGGRDVTDAPKFAAYGYDEHVGTYESPEPDPDITGGNWVWSENDKVKRWERSHYFVDRTLDFLHRNQEAPCFVNLWLDDVHMPWIPDEGAVAEKAKPLMKNLSAVTAEMDRQIGRLMDGVKKLGLDEKTLIIFASDNGPYPPLRGRTQGLRGCKLSLYEGGIRLPFIARWPGAVPAGVTDSSTVLASVDMFPTLCKLAGAKLPADVAWDGIDQSDALKGKPRTTRERPLLWEYGRNDAFFDYPKQPHDRSPQLAIRDGQWKLLVNADGQSAELYDLAVDRQETTNVADKHAEVVARLQKTLLEWRKSVP